MKLAIVVRKDLGMRSGKIAVQVGHASVSAFRISDDTTTGEEWFCEGQKKIVVKVYSLEELLEIKTKAMDAELQVVEIIDFGLTQIEPNTMTCIAIGPDQDHSIDDIIQELPLL